MIVIKDISVVENGKTIIYDYSVSTMFSKYFDKKNKFFASYEVDITSVPKSILGIPLLANLLPISWFLDFKIQIEELDSSFVTCVNELKSEFQKMYPNHELKGDLIVNNIITNSKAKSDKKAMLFSGGVDAISAYIRHCTNDLSLFSIRGADIELDDDERWNDLLDYNNTQKYLSSNLKYTISSNLRTFYTYKFENEVNLKWWGQVQHGLALLGVTAPLTHLLKIDSLYIGSTHTKKTQISWGSTPITDELLKWGDVDITHECYDLSRQEKIKSILDFSKSTKKSIGLRVCYSERRETLNCSSCEKCLRTIMGIILEGSNPNHFGFIVDASFYSKVDSLLKSKINTLGIYNHWKILQATAIKQKHFFVFDDGQVEKLKLEAFCNFHIKEPELIKRVSSWEKWKFALINKYPVLFNFYMKFRLKLIK
ncbi:hypothetical protein [Ancylomarina sp. 16SWW S1-10-2]|uniref:hypothetical protein n=1 Tax=Ancylomarina sp. 16SWW S1-10-2 TaxID=2499681 RepID=UPI0012AD9866|nr:hypothetical protein [Ancylomarina sp. 16SWW S1-10-2]MRT93461.1 hypothetical protein [Ancylomarina sp. 16SWW S1-10-2]